VRHRSARLPDPALRRGAVRPREHRQPEACRHFLITGSINEQNIPVIKTLYEQMPDPKAVVAIGICATSGGIFQECYNVKGGIDKVLPVDVYVPGCAARPEAIIDGVVQALSVLEKKHAALKNEPSKTAA
jgi:ech hydrogenase subunit C